MDCPNPARAEDVETKLRRKVLDQSEPSVVSKMLHRPPERVVMGWLRLNQAMVVLLEVVELHFPDS